MAIINGTLGADTLMGGTDTDTISGLDGNDLIVGGGGLDTLDGGAGNDTITGGAQDDVLIGGDGNDVMNGLAGSNRFIGGAGVDIANSLLLGAETFDGGEGEDVFFLDVGGATSARVTLRAANIGDGLRSDTDGLPAVRIQRENAAGVPTGPVSRTDDDDMVIVAQSGPDRTGFLDLRDVDGTVLGEFGVIILASAADDNIVARTFDRAHFMGGGLGNDTLVTGFSDDFLDGGAGNDVLIGGDGANGYRGGAGDDLILGGSGVDSAQAGDGADRVIGGGGADRLYGGAGADALTGDAGDDLLNGESGADVLTGGDGADLLSGEADDDLLFGGSGSDQLIGGLGADLLNGEAGDDALVGEAGSDTLSGEDGADLLIGGAGADVMIGGAGADRFVFLSAGDSTATALDLIVDFSGVQGDRVDLTAIDANANLSGDQAFVVVSAFSNVAGQATLTYSPLTNRTTLSGDVNGDGVADFVLTLVANVGVEGFLL